MDKMLTSWDIEKAFKIDHDRLREWIKYGYIEATVKANGVGTKNFFTAEDVFKILIFEKLIERGFTRKLAAKIIKDVSIKSNRIVIDIKYLRDKIVKKLKILN